MHLAAPASPMPSPVTSPLAGAYARLAAVFPGLRITEEAPRTGGGWSTARELADGGAALDAFLAGDDAQITRDYGRPARPDVTASFGLHRYAWPACLLFTVPFFLHRRVPLLTPDDVSFHRTDGRVTRMTVRPRGFACLPNDPAAHAHDAYAVPSRDALRAELRAAVAAHLAPVLDGFRSRTRRGSRALWGMVTDEITEGLWYVGHLLGEEDRAVAELAALMPGGTEPYPGGAAFRDLAGPGGTALRTRDRISCCLVYTLPSAETCVTCPRTCESDRLKRLTTNLTHS
ncbi:(2Fe-2S)-binding protein [Streptomyces sp. NBC_01262]|uniref:(2Fe-2S)-binding protein n=1 Tax=Streptomyces sp. NBC_01262 TaxID=2903803 RepID=UPI002E332D78|nr:(2Fe-2S)-binding protein [Streptomyces sp. NBC_01262]